MLLEFFFSQKIYVGIHDGFFSLFSYKVVGQTYCGITIPAGAVALTVIITSLPLPTATGDFPPLNGGEGVDTFAAVSLSSLMSDTHAHVQTSTYTGK